MIAYDKFTDEERNALDAIEQIRALNDLCGELKRIKSEKDDALGSRHAARLQAISEGVAFNRHAACLDAQLRVDRATNALATRKEQIRVLQTLLRSIPQ